MKRSGATPALAALTRAGVSFKQHEYQHDPRAESFGKEAANQLGWPAARVFKTLLATTGQELCVGVVPVENKLDLKALAAALGHKKLVMADPGQAERVTGMVLGGISPIGQKRRLPTVLDTSAFDFETILVSGGRRGLDVELRATDLVSLIGASEARIATG